MVKLHYHGHSCFEVEHGPYRVMVDPFLTGNPLADIGVEAVTRLDAVVVTHGHGDHLGDAVELSRQTGAPVIACFEIANHVIQNGGQAHALHIGGGHDFPFGRVKLTIAHHGSSGPQGEPLGTPAGVALFMGGKRIYHAGDTGLFLDMQLIGEVSGPLDAALLPIGDNFTMGIDDAARACAFLRPRVAIPMHYNTFPMIDADPEAFVRLVKRQGGHGVVVRPGETYLLD